AQLILFDRAESKLASVVAPPVSAPWMRGAVVVTGSTLVPKRRRMRAGRLGPATVATTRTTCPVPHRPGRWKGRHGRLKSGCRKACGFDPRPGHAEHHPGHHRERHCRRRAGRDSISLNSSRPVTLNSHVTRAPTPEGG